MANNDEIRSPEYIDLEEESLRLSHDRFERQKRISWWDQNLLKNSSILVAGVGTLGNEVCKNLALLGIGNVTIVDMDEIEEVNLSRSVLFRASDTCINKVDAAARRMRELYPEMSVTALKRDVVYEYGSASYRDFDLVLMTVDNREARTYINRYCHMWDTPLIDGGLDGLKCSVQVILPHRTACYECTFSDQDYRIISNRYGCHGLFRDAPEGKTPMMISTAAIAAGLMTQETLKILHKLDSSLAGKKVIIDGNLNEFNVLSLQKRECCLGHFRVEPEEAIDLEFSGKTTLRELKEDVGRHIDGTDFRIGCDKSIIYGARCPACGTAKDLLGLAGGVNEKELVCKCGSIMEPDISAYLLRDDKTLGEHGVPENHVLELYLGNGELRYLVPTADGRK